MPCKLPAGRQRLWDFWKEVFALNRSMPSGQAWPASKGTSVGYMWLMVVKIMVPFWVLNKIRHLVFRGPKRGPYF